jgi:non-reducing end alpha-L-arabinofuranosidase
MKKLRCAVLMAIPVSLGAFAIACWDYSSGDTLGAVPGSGGSAQPPGGGGSPPPDGGSNGGLPSSAPLPCDVLENAGLPCVSAHSTVRVVVSDYGGPLYQVEHPNGTTLDIGAVGGYADAAAQDAFCSGGGCVITVVYDQSSMGNDLTEAPPGSAKPTPGRPANAADLPVTINARSAYGILIRPGMGYRDVVPNGTAVLDEPQTLYMVSSQRDLINGCCFDYGSAETTANNDGNGTMEAVYLGMGVIWGTGVEGGPWVMADLENGLYPGWENGQDRNISTNTPLQYDFVTAVVVGDTADKNQGKGRFALYGGDATAGTLKQMYDGIRPEKPGYVPMRKQGSIILGIGGDNSNGGAGRFYEGVMANGAATKETVDALQAAIVAAGYGR